MSRNISTKIISLFLAFIMLFSVLPVQVFASGEGDVNTGSGENFTGGKKTAVGNWGSSSGKYHGMRFSLYFAEGNWGTYAEMKEAEARGEVTGFTRIGDIFETVITDTEGLLNGDCGTGINGVGIDYWSKKSAYDIMHDFLYGGYNGDWSSIYEDTMDYSKADYGDYVQNINNFSWVVPSPTENSDVNDMSRSRTSQKFPTLFQTGQSATIHPPHSGKDATGTHGEIRNTFWQWSDVFAEWQFMGGR